MDTGSTAGTTVPAKGTLAGWIGYSVLVAIVVGVSVGVGVATAFGKVSGGSFTSSGWMVGTGIGLGVLAILVAIGFVRFESVERPSYGQRPAHPPAPSS